MATHAVTNQVEPRFGHNAFLDHAVVREAAGRWAAPQAFADLEALGDIAGSAEGFEWAQQANLDSPRLRTHSRTGERIDEVEFHPAWHALMTVAVGHGLTAGPWLEPADSGAHAARAAGFLTWSQLEQGHLCPISMTYAAAPALAASPALADTWLPRLASRTYDPGLRPGGDKRGALAGMGMTEKQGGSDVRANTTQARALEGGPLHGATYRLTGHKWFCSAPMNDVFLVLAQAPAGLSCFLVPRILEDGSRNFFAIQRLKDKLGNRSNASAEIELDGTWGALVGPEGGGLRTILAMVAATRLDCILGSAATMRSALTSAMHHARHRSAFGARLVDQPLMRNVLADLCLESEAAALLGMRLAHALDTGDDAFARLGVALGKFWVCKRTVPMVAEALECLGGNGYVEENGLARLYREAPLNSIWEGSGNVNALDVLRAMTREPESVEALRAVLAPAYGTYAGLDAAIDEVPSLAAAAGSPDAAWGARHTVERVALTLQGALLVQHSPAAVADAFVASRLAGQQGVSFGTLGAVDTTTILSRALPG